MLTARNSYPPDNEDKQKQLGEFFGKFPPPKVAGQVPDYVKALKERDSSITKFAILGVSSTSRPSYLEKIPLLTHR